METVFPEALQSLQQADPELAAIIDDEKNRQWYGARIATSLPAVQLAAIAAS